MFLLISLLIILFTYVFYITNPNPESFRTFITRKYAKLQEEGSTSSYGAAWIKNFAAKTKAKAHGRSSSLDFTWKNYQLFSIVKLKDGSAVYLGCLNRWSLFSESGNIKASPTPVAGSSRQEEPNFSNIGQEARDDAKQALAKKKYKRAGARFQEAGEAFMKLGDELSTREAAICFEEAYNAYKHTNYEDKTLQALKDAATVFDSTKKDPNRAGKFFEKIGDYYEKTNNGKPKKTALALAFGYYKKATEIFRAADNGHFKYSLIHQAELAAQIGHYDEAIPWLEELARISVNDPTLTFKVKSFLFQACICMIALEEWSRISLAYKEYATTYGSFLNSDEYRLIDSLVEAACCFDSSQFTEAYQRYHDLAPLPNWILAILSRAATAVQFLDGNPA